MNKSSKKQSLLRRNLCLSTGDGAAYSVMVGTGETWLAAFVIAAGLGQTTSGLIASVPLLAGAVLQLISPIGVKLLGSHRKWVVGCAHTQAFALFALAFAAVLGTMPVAAAFLVAAVYWGAALGGGSAWNTWIGTIVPRSIRAPWIARRSRAMQFCTLFGFICGGAVLQWLGPEGKTLGFAGLFVFAGCSRLLSAHLLSKQSEPIPLPPGQKHVGPVELLLRLRKGPDGRLILYMFCVTFAAQVAAPFFTPFMVSQLKLSWMDYTWLIAVSFAARVVSLPFLGAFAKRKGAGSLLLAAGILIAPISAAWIFAWQSFVALFVIQILAGIVWGAYELATTLLIFERIAPEERTSILTTHNFINAVTMVTGSLLGATVLGTFQESFTGYLVIFGLSGALRAATVLLLLRTWRIPTSGGMIPMRTMAIRPYGNTVTQPILDHDHRK